MQVVQENYVTILIAWILLGVLEFYLLIVRDTVTARRWKLFAKANGLEEFETKEEWFPGNLRKDGSVYQAFRIASKPGRHVWFGIVHGWFDPDHKMPVAASYASDDFENVLFVRVNSKSFKGTATIYGPNHPVIRENLPAMTDSAFQSLCALASKYSVVIGKGAFTVSHAAGVYIASSASLEHTDLSLESRWLVMTGLISGTMATVVEGLVD